MQYLDENSELGEESQESLIRQHELRERKNQILQLLNGDVSDEDGEEIEQEYSQQSSLEEVMVDFKSNSKKKPSDSA